MTFFMMIMKNIKESLYNFYSYQNFNIQNK